MLNILNPIFPCPVTLFVWSRKSWLILFAAGLFSTAGPYVPLGFAQEQPDFVTTYIYRQRTQAAFEEQMRLVSEFKLEAIARECDLDDGLRKKLDLAARRDVARLFQDIETVKKETEGLKVGNNEDYQKGWKATEKLFSRIQNGVWDESTTLMRLLPKMLDAEQAKKYAAYTRRLVEQQRQVSVKLMLVELGRAMPLAAKQRQGVLDAIAKEPLPVKFQRGNERYFGNVYLCKLPEETLAEIFDAQQMVVVRELRKKYDGYKGIFQWQE